MTRQLSDVEKQALKQGIATAVERNLAQAKLTAALDSGSPISIRTIDAAFSGVGDDVITMEQRIALKSLLLSRRLLTE
jgi:hypothetical protein